MVIPGSTMARRGSLTHPPAYPIPSPKIYFDNQARGRLPHEISHLHHPVVGPAVPMAPVGPHPPIARKLLEEQLGALIGAMEPCRKSEERRMAVYIFVRSILEEQFPCISCHMMGSFPLKAYLSDSDLDITILTCSCRKCGERRDEMWLVETNQALCVAAIDPSARAKADGMQIQNVALINARTKVINCRVMNIAVDLTINQRNGLASLAFLEEVDRCIGHGHLFKRTLLLIKGWCLYESTRYVGTAILGSKGNAGLSSYALSVMVLALFDDPMGPKLRTPLQVFIQFLQTYHRFDWGKYLLTLTGPLPLSELKVPPTTKRKNTPIQHLPRPSRFSHLIDKVHRHAQASHTDTAQHHPPCLPSDPPAIFPTRCCNIQDPLDPTNNLGYSLTPTALHLLTYALTQAHHHLSALLLQPPPTPLLPTFLPRLVATYLDPTLRRSDLLNHPCEPRTNIVYDDPPSSTLLRNPNSYLSADLTHIYHALTTAHDTHGCFPRPAQPPTSFRPFNNAPISCCCTYSCSCTNRTLPLTASLSYSPASSVSSLCSELPSTPVRMRLSEAGREEPVDRGDIQRREERGARSRGTWEEEAEAEGREGKEEKAEGEACKEKIEESEEGLGSEAAVHQQLAGSISTPPSPSSNPSATTSIEPSPPTDSSAPSPTPPDPAPTIVPTLSVSTSTSDLLSLQETTQSRAVSAAPPNCPTSPSELYVLPSAPGAPTVTPTCDDTSTSSHALTMNFPPCLKFPASDTAASAHATSAVDSPCPTTSPSVAQNDAETSTGREGPAEEKRPCEVVMDGEKEDVVVEHQKAGEVLGGEKEGERGQRREGGVSAEGGEEDKAKMASIEQQPQPQEEVQEKNAERATEDHSKGCNTAAEMEDSEVQRGPEGASAEDGEEWKAKMGSAERQQSQTQQQQSRIKQRKVEVQEKKAGKGAEDHSKGSNTVAEMPQVTDSANCVEHTFVPQTPVSTTSAPHLHPPHTAPSPQTQTLRPRPRSTQSNTKRGNKGSKNSSKSRPAAPLAVAIASAPPPTPASDPSTSTNAAFEHVQMEEGPPGPVDVKRKVPLYRLVKGRRRKGMMRVWENLRRWGQEMGKEVGGKLTVRGLALLLGASAIGMAMVTLMSRQGGKTGAFANENTEGESRLIPSASPPGPANVQQANTLLQDPSLGNPYYLGSLLTAISTTAAKHQQHEAEQADNTECQTASSSARPELLSSPDAAATPSILPPPADGHILSSLQSSNDTQTTLTTWVIPGTSLHLTCPHAEPSSPSSTHPRPTLYTWTRNGQSLQPPSSHPNYLLHNIQPSSEGLYICHRLHSDNHSLYEPQGRTLIRLSTPPVLRSKRTHPIETVLVSGSTLTLSLRADGLPTPQYQWRRNGQVIDGAVYSRLYVPEVEKRHAGRYSVEVWNMAGRVTREEAVVEVVES